MSSNMAAPSGNIENLELQLLHQKYNYKAKIGNLTNITKRISIQFWSQRSAICRNVVVMWALAENHNKFGHLRN